MLEAAPLVVIGVGRGGAQSGGFVVLEDENPLIGFVVCCQKREEESTFDSEEEGASL